MLPCIHFEWSLESQFDLRIIQGRGNTSSNVGYLLQPKTQIRFRNDFGWATSTPELKIKLETMVSLVTFKNYLNSWVGCLCRDYTKYIVLKILTHTVFFPPWNFSNPISNLIKLPLKFEKKCPSQICKSRNLPV